MGAEKILAELDLLVTEWDQQAKSRHIEGMAASADAYRDCRDDLRRLIKRAQKETAKS